MKNIWLIRHGESQSNAGERTDSPHLAGLSPPGKVQACEIANVVTRKPDLVIYTPYIRTQLSVKPLLEKFPTVTAEEWPLQEFTYLNQTKFHRTTRNERKAAKLDYWQKCDPAYSDGDGAESYYDFQARIEKGIEQLKKQTGYVLVYTHGHVIRAILWYLLLGRINRDEDSFKRFYHLRQALNIPNGAIVKLDLNNEEPEMSAILTDHLSC